MVPEGRLQALHIPDRVILDLEQMSRAPKSEYGRNTVSVDGTQVTMTFVNGIAVYGLDGTVGPFEVPPHLDGLFEGRKLSWLRLERWEPVDARG